MQDALAPGLAQEYIRQLIGVVNLLPKGEVVEEARPWMMGAKLVALPKPDGSLSPIVAGEVIRRVVGRSAFGG